MKVIDSLLGNVDSLLVGGGMAYTFFRAKGYATGKSLVEEDKVPLAAELLKKGTGKIVLPVDHVVASKFAADAEHRELPAQEMPDGWMGLDIGPVTRRAYAERLRAARSQGDVGFDAHLAPLHVGIADTDRSQQELELLRVAASRLCRPDIGLRDDLHQRRS